MKFGNLGFSGGGKKKRNCGYCKDSLFLKIVHFENSNILQIEYSAAGWAKCNVSAE